MQREAAERDTASLVGMAIGGIGPVAVAGVVGAISAALSFDFFHTMPYRSLTITSADDVETTVLLVIAGLVAVEIAVRARRSRIAAEEGRSESSRIHRIAELSARGDDAADVILAVQAELSALLSLQDCRFEAPPFASALPELECPVVAVALADQVGSVLAAQRVI